MREDSVVIRVCQIPTAFRNPNGESLQQLVAKSGYFDASQELSATAVEGRLRSDPWLVDQWFRFCEDKRTSAGWYVVEDNHRFVVGQVGGQSIVFADRVAACAEYIVREIGSVARPDR